MVFKDLPEQVVVEVLLGLQWRTDAEIQTRMTILRALVRLARQKRAQSIFDLLTGAMDISRGDLAALLRGMTLAVQRSLSSPELEQRRDRWDLTMFGGNGQINFTVLHQPWLREAAKHWAIEDLPLHRGRQATATAKQTIRAVGHLSWSLRHARADHGLDVRSLSRADVVAFTNRMAFLQRSGEISEYKRVFICRRVRRFLDDVRAFGLTRPDQVLAGLPDDFRLRPGDVPADAADDSPGRDLPVPVLRTINAELPLLEELSGVEIRRIIEILIDTGRRPDEICQLPWDCLGTTADGRDLLIYTDNKNNRPHRRLPIGGETAELIRSYRQDLLQRFPGTPLERLALFPRSYRNPRGDHHVKVDSLSRFHRKFIDLIADKLRDDAGQPFPALAVVPYAYRHSYAQRHADNGTSPDVLRDLMGHSSMQNTMAYYRVTEVRVRHAVEQVALQQYDGQGRRIFAAISGFIDEDHVRLRVGQVAVPFGICTEPTNVKAGGQACPYKFTCIGCGHFRSDVSYLPELKAYLQQLLADRERILAATDIQDWARAQAAPSSEGISQLRSLIRRVETGLDDLSAEDQLKIREAINVVRSARQTVPLGMPSTRSHPEHLQ